LSLELKIDLNRATVHSILRRNGRIAEDESLKRVPFTRFEHEKPNDLWQMDFMGPITTARGRFDPLTVIDDHSRFNLCLKACPDQRRETVQDVLTQVFTRYGLPWRMTMDNGSPWGDDGLVLLTRLTAWLIRLGIGVSHSRPYHPQTQGKDERLHRTIRDELTNHVAFLDGSHLQRDFDTFQHRYNYRRPHEALHMERPADRYRPSSRSMPKKLLPLTYGEGVTTRCVDTTGKIAFRGHSLRVGRGCMGMMVGLRETAGSDTIEVFFCDQRIALVDLSNADDPRVIRSTRPRSATPGLASSSKVRDRHGRIKPR
jgi:transposase InsO family protein